MSTPDLNPRQQSFVREYAIDTNATQAAIRAGYSKATASQIGARLLTNVKVEAEIVKVRLELARKGRVSAERIVEEYARIAFLNPQDMYDDEGRLLPIKDMPEGAARAIAGIDEEDIYLGVGEDRRHVGSLKKIRLTSKVAALEGLARHLGMFKDAEQSGGTTFQVQVNIGTFAPQQED